MGGKMIWVVIILYGGLVAGAFFIANSENSKAKKAGDLAHSALNHAEALDAKLLDLEKKLEESERKSDEAYKKLVEIMLTNDSHGTKLKEKLEWLEMKVSNMPKASPSPSKVVLTQDKPIQFTVITRQGPPVKAKPKASTMIADPAANERRVQMANPATAREALIKNVKKKVDELSQ